MILDKILNRHFPSLEDPTVPLTGQNLTMAQVFGGSGSLSAGGEVVTPGTSLTLSPVWAAVDIISSSIAKLPLHVMARIEPSGSEIDRQHASERLLINPNGIMTGYVYKQLIMVHALLYGNHVSLIVRDNGGRAIELLPFRPGAIQVVSANGGYFYRDLDGHVESLIPAIDVLHVKNFGFDGIIGLSPITNGKNTIGLGLGLNRFANQFFKNDARPGIALSHPGHLSEEAHKNLRNSWIQMHSGANRGGVAVLEEGITLTSFGVTPEDSQTVESLNFNISDVARLFRIQPHKLSDLSHATFSNIEESNRQFLDDTLDPWLTAIEQECDNKLLLETEKQSRSHFFNFNTRKLTRMNLKARTEVYRAAWETGWMSGNDIRASEDLPPVDGGDVYYRPLNFTPVNQPAEQVVEEEVTDAERANLIEAIHRVLGRLASKAQKATRSPGGFIEWLDTSFVKDNETVTASALSTPLAIVGGDALIGELTAAVFDGLRADLLELAGRNNAEQIYPAMERLGYTWLQTKPEKLADDFLAAIKERRNGT